MAIIDDYREAAIPRLREAAKVQAFFVALDLVEIDEARSTVYALASKLGSGLLTSSQQDRLSDWISEVIWAELEKAHDRAAVMSMRIEEAIKSDPVRYYEGLAKRCTKPDTMRWVFALHCKPYRDWLIQERRSARTT